MNFIYPSILSADFAMLKEQIEELEKNSIKTIHVDIMDGKFVPNISFGFPILKCIREITNLNLDVHLMIDDPIRYIDKFAECGADLITVHIEGNYHIHRVIQEIKKYNIKAGVAINPGTPINNLKEILPLVDLVLVMGVNPGFGGQVFIENTINRIKELWQIKNDNTLNFDINVDGGVKSSNYMRILEYGVNNVIIGSDLFKNNDITSNISEFR